VTEIAMPPLAVNPGIPPRPARLRPVACWGRLRISPATWSAIGAFMSRERLVLMATEPTSPRVMPMLQRLRFLEREAA
jgi:hypothetical protein